MAIPSPDADTVHSMPAKGPLRVLVLLVAACLLPVLTVSAHHDPQVSDVLAAAGTLGMGCETFATEVHCYGPSVAANRNPMTIIRPTTGPLTDVYTRVNAHTNGIHDFLPEDRDWFAALHQVGCADTASERAEVRKFMDDLFAMFSTSQSGGTFTATPGECGMKGSLVLGTGTAPVWYWEVTSTPTSAARPTPTVKPTPTPTPKPTPTPTPRPTATPAPTPTVSPTATQRPTGTPTARPTPTAIARPTATATGNATATANGSVSPSPTATAAAAVNTPEQTVLGFTFTPEPSSAAPAPAGTGNDWAGSVRSASQVSADAKKLAGSGLAALLLLLAMGFIGELFNDTFESNYDRILAGWQKSWLGKIAKAFSGLWGGGK